MFLIKQQDDVESLALVAVHAKSNFAHNVAVPQQSLRTSWRKEEVTAAWTADAEKLSNFCGISSCKQNHLRPSGIGS